MANFNNMLKQAQKMQKDVEKAQGELAEMEVTYANNGIEIIAKGDFTLKSIFINRDLINVDDKEILEDVLLVAANGALQLVRERTESKLSGLTGGLNLPGLF